MAARQGFLATLLVLASGATATVAQPVPAAAPAVLPPAEIVARVRAGGFEPVGKPHRSGSTFELAALDPYDLPVRVIADGRNGRILAVRHEVGSAGEEAAIPIPVRSRRSLWPFGPVSEPNPPIPPRPVPLHAVRRDPAGAAPIPRERPEARATANGANRAPGSTANAAASPSGTSPPPASTDSTGATLPQTGSRPMPPPAPGAITVPIAPLE